MIIELYSAVLESPFTKENKTCWKHIDQNNRSVNIYLHFTLCAPNQPQSQMSQRSSLSRYTSNSDARPHREAQKSELSQEQNNT